MPPDRRQVLLHQGHLLLLVHLLLPLLELLDLQHRGLLLEHHLAHGAPLRLRPCPARAAGVDPNRDLRLGPPGLGLRRHRAAPPASLSGLPQPPHEDLGAVVQVAFRGLLRARLRRVGDLLGQPQRRVCHDPVPHAEPVLEDPDDHHGVVLWAPPDLPGPCRGSRQHVTADPEVQRVGELSYGLLHQLELPEQVGGRLGLRRNPKEAQRRILLLFLRDLLGLSLPVLLGGGLPGLQPLDRRTVLPQRRPQPLRQQPAKLRNVVLRQVGKVGALRGGVPEDVAVVVEPPCALQEGLGLNVAKAGGAAVPLPDAVHGVPHHPCLGVRGRLGLGLGLDLGLLLGSGLLALRLKESTLCDLLLGV
mmetsp:Transcript_3706/g.11164  ORF Transcript_3706/g.11164 Transcript_3706/m.11164 type:complete len:361 (+) Transcript_3706:192-1274(+)